MLRGYILHHRPYRESSVIVNLLVDGVGRVDALVRVGSGKKSLKSIIQPFQPLIFQFNSKSGSTDSSLKFITQVEPAAPALPLKAESLYSAMYLNELLVRVVNSGQHAEGLFLHYHRSLMDLAQQFSSSHLRYFEMELLLELGALPSLDYDTLGEMIMAGCSYRFVADAGFAVVNQAASEHFSSSRNLLAGEMLIQLKQKQLTPEHLIQAKGLMRYLLTPLLGGKPLLSRKLFIKQ
ncbi:DNA repair protein RecO [Shewanella sp. UCD-KL21]|uniref:DNA repair protein RecO n=1 Tax=Shewanella sp. UCD-KL21 TaxID=1917164 RepID=UPI000970D947|nr:DNA repair protein RecO [Shewanella sp. UCD-KL21]